MKVSLESQHCLSKTLYGMKPVLYHVIILSSGLESLPFIKSDDVQQCQSKETHAKSSMRVIHIELHYTASPHTCIQCHLFPLP